jgi:SAM-dependent methyltransferase
MGLPRYARYIWQWGYYSRMPRAEHLAIRDAFPIFGETTRVTSFDPHYVFQAIWATKRIMANRPAQHFDVGSDHRFVTILSAYIATTFVDYRPLNIKLSNLTLVGGDILNLPFNTNSIISLSSLHTIEHIGLGRYGEPLDPLGTKKASHELFRVLAPGGNLYISLPIGRKRVCFNAQRICPAEEIVEYFKPLELIEFSGVGDDKHFIENTKLSEFNNNNYACAMFWFKKK